MASNEQCSICLHPSNAPTPRRFRPPAAPAAREHLPLIATTIRPSSPSGLSSASVLQAASSHTPADMCMHIFAKWRISLTQMRVKPLPILVAAEQQQQQHQFILSRLVAKVGKNATMTRRGGWRVGQSVTQGNKC